MEERINELIQALTLEEKIGLLSGADYWHSKAVEQLGIQQLLMCDGPHGLRKQKHDELGIGKSYPATCFPTAALLACSWDEELATKQGEVIGTEARALGVSCVLGPGINIKRSPLCGRNFEYFSEDPLLSGRMGAGVVNGIQSQGVSACLKHFAANNQEDYRFWVDVRADEKTLHEIYLASFEYALMHCKPMAMMSSYNKINGLFTSENKWLLTDVLGGDWGYDGIVMSDWGAVNNRAQALWAGLDLEMPGSFGVNDGELLKAATGKEVGLCPTTRSEPKASEVKGSAFVPPTDPNFDNTLTEEQIDISVKRMLRWILSLEATTEPQPCDFEPHHFVARKIAAESMVLLENGEIPYGSNPTTRKLLPLSKKDGTKIVVIGEFAEMPVYQGGGSSHIVPTEVDIPLEQLKQAAGKAKITYLRGAKFPLSKEDKKAVKKADAVVVFIGTPNGFDTEGTDRKEMLLSAEQCALVAEVNKTNINTVTVVSVGAPVMLPKSTGLLLTYLAGQGMGGAVAALLFGDVNPSGRLAETFPMRVEDTPCYQTFPGDGKIANYAEGTKVGYRWYNHAKLETRYPFGSGLSYTEFEYEDYDICEKSGTATVKVRNVGEYDGKEVVQVFIDGELRGFKKVFIEKGESVTVEVAITPKAGAAWRERQAAESLKVDMTTQVKALWNLPKGRGLFEEICGKFGVQATEELVNTRDCSSFVGNMLRNMVTMFDLGWTFEDLQERIDRINEANGVKP